MKKLVISIVLVNLLAACASQKPKETSSAPAPTSASVAAPATSASTAVDALNDPKSILAGRSVFYPFDVSVVQDADKPLVQAHAKYLSENAARNVKLEGNCDERGSNEYNLGLGQRRADGVQKMLVLGGAKAAQLNSVSYGEEKPRASSHDEASWSQNRRTDLNYAK
ncbi:MAG: peptidoglycan-associated lipoprotein Pal [Gallionella sp.]|nr:peptidoglycan-associated lipoprotein Pal [Gallionella sp.]